MKERHSYQGKLNGISGIWCDHKPEGIEITKEITFYTPDEGMIFTKDGELYDSVVIQEGVDIKNYIEIKDPRPQTEESEEPKPIEE